MALSLIPAITIAILIGAKPYRFWANFQPTPNWFIDETYPISATQRSKSKSKRLKVEGKVKVFQPLNNQIDFTTICRLEIGKETYAGYLLKGGEVHFVWKCEGFNPLQESTQKFKEVCDKLDSLFKELGCTTTVVFSSSTDFGSTAKTETAEFANQELALLFNSGKKRKKGLSQQGERKNVTFYLHTIYRFHKSDSEKSWLDKVSDKTTQFIQQIFNSNKGGDESVQELTTLLKQTAMAAQRYKILMEEGGLSPVNLNVPQLWDYLCSKLSKPVSANPAYTLNLDRSENLKIEYSSNYKKGDLHSLNQILGKYPPVTNRRDIYCPNLDKFFGVLVLEAKPLAFKGHTGLLQYLLPLYSQKWTSEIEIISEITPANSTLAAMALEKLTNNAISAQNQASNQNRVSVVSTHKYEQSIAGRSLLVQGEQVFHQSLVVVVAGKTQAEVDDTCHRLQALIPAKLRREEQYAPRIFLESKKLRQKPNLYSPFNRRLLFFGKEAIGLFPFTQTNKLDESGFELIAQPDSRPVFIDDTQHFNTWIIAATGAGKSVFAISWVLSGLKYGSKGIIIESASTDGSSTFGEIASFLPNVIYFDTGKDSHNLLEPPDSSTDADDEKKKELFEIFLGSLINIITRLVLGSHSLESFLVKRITDLIPLLLRAFYEDSDIMKGFATGGDNIPTLHNLVQFCTPHYIELEEGDKEAYTALGIIRTSLQSCLAKPIGKSIGRPSTIDLNAQIVVITLNNVTNDQDAELNILQALHIGQQQALSSTGSTFFLDEASINLGFPSVSRAVGQVWATGRKGNYRGILAAQEVESIMKSEAAQQIEANTALKLIGRIESSSQKQYTKHLDIPPHIISRNSAFRTDKTKAYSTWLVDYKRGLDDKRIFLECRYYPSFILLALTINNPKEKAIREEFKKRYPNTWVIEFGKYLENRTVV